MSGPLSIFYFIVLIISIIVHEVAHGLVAEREGDPTARVLGRITLNPLKHIDWLGSVILPFILIVSNAGFVIGWQICMRMVRGRSLPPLPVPARSIYSRLDGIVDWRTCIAPVDDRHENVRVYASHLGMGHDPSVMWVVADRLGLPAGTWAPFSPPWYARLYYPSVHDVPTRSPAAAAA